MRDINGPGEIYIVQTRQSIVLCESVYKIGRAWDAGERLRGYPKGSALICRLPVSRMKDAEDMVKLKCRAELLQRLDYGAEYFEGELLVVMQKLVDTGGHYWRGLGQGKVVASVQERSEGRGRLDGPMSPPRIVEDDVQALVHASSTDETILLQRYIQLRIGELSKMPVDSARLLDEVMTMMRATGCNKNMCFKRLVADLRRYFGVEEIMSHPFPDGPRHAVVFKVPPSDVMVTDGTFESQGDQLPTSNKLEEFLSMNDEQRGCCILRVEGKITWMSDFKHAFNTIVTSDLVIDNTVFASRGFRVSAKPQNVCLKCMGLSKGGDNKCCPLYSRTKGFRSARSVIFDMVLTPTC